MLDKTLAIVLAGGSGTRLAPLTDDRAKPAVPFGGKYRIIDFCLSNCLHSGLRRILVLTQYKSHSLQKHLRDGWSIFNPELGEYVTTVPPQMRVGAEWYQGTADAIYQNIYLLERSNAEHVLVLSADHIYRMDYAAMLTQHVKRHAEISVACMPVSLEEARAFGVMGIDPEERVTHFEEKPSEPTPLPDDPKQALASMGIYIFSKELLVELLKRDHQDSLSSHDFGKDILPSAIDERRIIAYRFGASSGRVSQDSYWRDVGTLDSFYAAHMDLLKPVPPLDLYQQDWPIRTRELQTPPARTVPGESGTEGISINSIIASGTIIAGGSVQHSILFPHVFVGDEAIVEDSILFHGVKVGKGARLRNCIIDKGVEIPEGIEIGQDAKADAERFTVTDKGVVVIAKRTVFD